MFLEKHQEFLTHQRNLQGIITEIYDIVNLVAPPIMNSLFWVSITIRKIQIQDTRYSTDTRNTVNHRLETVIYKAPPREKLPFEYKFASFLDEFKLKIKLWKCEMCICRLCKQYHPNLGYIRKSRITLPRYFDL